jgi:hypothetical protein
MDKKLEARVSELDTNLELRSGFGSQLRPSILNKSGGFRCDRIRKQAIYVPGFSTSQNRVAPV